MGLPGGHFPEAATCCFNAWEGQVEHCLVVTPPRRNEKAAELFGPKTTIDKACRNASNQRPFFFKAESANVNYVKFQVA